ncbi:MAG: 50S ribosomal protein L2 [Candidatus Micrarchaeia archaeon]
MGKHLRQQRRGKGSPTYRRPSHRFVSDARYRKYDALEKEGSFLGYVRDFVDDRARDPLLMDVVLENGENLMLIAPEGIKAGDTIEMGIKAKPTLGSVLPLAAIPDGLPIYNIELNPGDGGKFVRSAGACAYVVSHEENGVTIMLPSKKMRNFNPLCRAQVGVICAGGMKEKPIMKAGKKFYMMKARNLDYPCVRGVAMNPVAHPFGGKEHHRGRSSCVSRNAPPGRKVGHLAAKSTGRRK